MIEIKGYIFEPRVNMKTLVRFDEQRALVQAIYDCPTPENIQALADFFEEAQMPNEVRSDTGAPRKFGTPEQALIVEREREAAKVAIRFARNARKRTQLQKKIDRPPVITEIDGVTMVEEVGSRIGRGGGVFRLSNGRLAWARNYKSRPAFQHVEDPLAIVPLALRANMIWTECRVMCASSSHPSNRTIHPSWDPKTYRAQGASPVAALWKAYAKIWLDYVFEEKNGWRPGANYEFNRWSVDDTTYGPQRCCWMTVEEHRLFTKLEKTHKREIEQQLHLRLVRDRE